MAKDPNPIDKHVGGRVRMRRLVLGLSQEKLADALGLTFQQVQKYEKGTNRISASRLQAIANILNVDTSYFFDGSPGGSEAAATGFGEGVASGFITEFVATAEGVQLNKAFIRITDPLVRKRIIDLVTVLAASSSKPG